MSYWYLATPYSKYPGGHHEAFRQAAKAAGLLHNAGHTVFSPIVHSHPLVTIGGVDGTDFDAWRGVDEVMMYHAYGLIVCMLPGWDKSAGVAEEMKFFRDRFPRRPLRYMEPGSATLHDYPAPLKEAAP